MHLRPLGIGELLDAALKVCIAHRGTLARVILVVVVPAQLVGVAVLASTIPGEFLSADAETTADPTGSDLALFGAGYFVYFLLTGVMVLLGMGACFRAITEAWLGHEPDWRDSLRFAVRRAPTLLLMSVVYFLVVLVAYLLLIVPGIWASFALALCFPIVLVERIGPLRALGRSRRLVKGRWWATAGAILIGYILATILSTVAQFAFAVPLVFAIDSPVLFLVFNALGAAVGYLIATPFQAAIVAAAYFDLRVRKEGLDLELVAERIGARAPGGAPEAAQGAPAPA